jgi:hypothetical protein
MTLGQMIARYEELGETMVEHPGEAMSARAVYAHVGFDPAGGRGRIPATQAAELARAVIGQVFFGYKGGDFEMHEGCPVWIAAYGSSGDPLVGINDDGDLLIGGEGRLW